MQTMSTVRNLTVSEIAQREHISTDTVKRAIKNGHLPAHRIGSRGDWRIKVEDYEAWLANGAPTSPTKQEPTE
jgi:excisionase family DNA binding protein